ncbi:MAG: polysaccharide deacetylase family protein [Ignavibacteriales bacterium]|nr:polysaccharide deacetylase family protein [Ignavibacteriales bacterium]
MNVCLTFDDAGVDFYYYVYPIIQAYQLKVLLAVPAGRIQDDTSASREQRLSFSPLTPIHERHPDHFCTWKELQEMSATGSVRVASHGMTHRNLLTTDKYEEELRESKRLIEQKLRTDVSSLVFPYGMFNLHILTTARAEYRHLFAVGAVNNGSWNGIDGIIYRIPCDGMIDPSAVLARRRLLGYTVNTPKMKLKTWLMKRKKFSYKS